MRKLKFQLSRTSLNQIYISYLRPILEYASVVWDGCTDYEKSALEKLQNEAARIVTGLTRSVSLEHLRHEIGWQSLSIRRSVQKLSIMYKATNGETPSYISNLIPPAIHNLTNYNLRNRLNINVPYSRLEIHKQSFIPSAINLWNNINPTLRMAENIKQFKSKVINQLYIEYNIPLHYLKGDRFLSVIHARLRNKCSNLNSDLCNNHIREDPYCECAEVVEDAEHYFFMCPKFQRQRTILLQSLHAFLPLNTTDLLKGKPQLPHPANCAIFSAVQTYIKETKRFNP